MPAVVVGYFFMELYILQSLATRSVYVGLGSDHRQRAWDHKSKLKTGVHKAKKLRDHVKQYGLDDLRVKFLEATDDTRAEPELIELLSQVAPDKVLNTHFVPNGLISPYVLSKDRNGRRAHFEEHVSNFDVVDLDDTCYD